MLQDDARISDRMQFHAVRALTLLPKAVQLKLSGQPAITVDGQTLHPELQLILALRERLRAVEMSALPPEEGRRRLRREALAFAGPDVPLLRVRDLDIALGDDTRRARHYVPLDAGERAALLVFFHGGGFVLGDLESHDSVCRLLAADAGIHVLSVEYRLAPEHPFPAPLEDACAAFEWAASHAEFLGVDPSRIGVGGDSAGGSLACVVAQLAAQNGTPAPAMQLLLYPALDRTRCRPSLDLFAKGFFLSRADVEWFANHYLGTADIQDPRVSPLLATNLQGVAPAVIVTAGFDPLRDEGEDYARMLKDAGNRVLLHRYPSFIHAFANMAGVSPACRRATKEIAGWVRDAFGLDARR